MEGTIDGVEYEGQNSETVAKLTDRVPYPYEYSSLSMSPYGRLIAIAGKDTLRFVSIKPSGLREVKTIRISQFFHAPRSIGVLDDPDSNNSIGQQKNDLTDMFVPNAAIRQGPTPTNIAISITDIAWSFQQQEKKLKKPRSRSNDYADSSYTSIDDGLNGESIRAGIDSTRDPLESIISMPEDLLMADSSLIAVAGSNGVVVVWRTCDILGGFGSNLPQGGSVNIFGSSMNRQQLPEQSMDHFLFLQNQRNRQGAGGGGNHRESGAPSAAIGQPEAIIVKEHLRAVNKIAWHRHKPGVFLTGSQDATLKMFVREENENVSENQNINNEHLKWPWLRKARSSSKIKTYSWKCVKCFKPNNGPIKDVQWSHNDDDLFALVTLDGFLVVHNMQFGNSHRPMVRIAAHAGRATTLDWHPSDPFKIATGSLDKTVKVWDLESEINSFYVQEEINNLRQNSNSVRSQSSFDSSSYVSGDSSPTNSNQDQDQLSHSYHGGGSSHSLTMRFGNAHRNKIHAAYELSVAAQVEKIRWRPIMSFHDTDLLGITEEATQYFSSMLAVATSPAGAAAGGHGNVSLWSYHRPYMPLSIVEGHKEGAVTDFLWLDTPEIEEDEVYFVRKLDGSDLKGSWQHVLTIGRDGGCLVQSFARGERPLSHVAPSAFAITNLSPFQNGFGSLQVIVAHQNVPSGQNNDYLLCGLRRDEFTAQAPGFFKENIPSEDTHAVNKYEWQPFQNGCKEGEDVHLSFFATDSGALEDLQVDSKEEDDRIAPEVMHLSRFAEGYKLHTDSNYTTKASVCRYNASVAMDLNCKGHARMWNMLASMLEGSVFNNRNLNKSLSITSDVMSYVLLPTLKSLLLQRADRGDVQTCVILCEVMEVIGKTSQNSVTVLVPGIDLMIIRQWYLAYIDILQQMCLFSHAALLIANCKDPKIAKLNQTSTTVYKSCPFCSKPLEGGKETCKSCRRKVGLCFICHQPTKGVFVMCPGCGHGGCLEHAIEWFNDPKNNFREYCPTGCGHRCNLMLHPWLQPKQKYLTCITATSKEF